MRAGKHQRKINLRNTPASGLIFDRIRKFIGLKLRVRDDIVTQFFIEKSNQLIGRQIFYLLIRDDLWRKRLQDMQECKRIAPGAQEIADELGDLLFRQ